MEVIVFPGLSGTGQIIHGISDGESHFINATCDDLNSAFTFGPKNDLEAKA